MTQTKALKLALEVMRNNGDVSVDEWIAAENAIKEALAQPEQEPVAWAMFYNGYFIDAIDPDEHARIEGDYKHALYTTPPQRTWVGLTGGEVLDVLVSVDKETVRLPSMLGIFARAIEAKLCEKNT